MKRGSEVPRPFETTTATITKQQQRLKEEQEEEKEEEEEEKQKKSSYLDSDEHTKVIDAAPSALHQMPFQRSMAVVMDVHRYGHRPLLWFHLTRLNVVSKSKQERSSPIRPIRRCVPPPGPWASPTASGHHRPGRAG